MEAFECYLLEYTGKYTPFDEGISTPIYRRVDNGALEHVGWTNHPGIPMVKSGAMYFEVHGKDLMVRTPGGEWRVDGLSSRSQSPWTREGVPPKITVRPSILFRFDQKDEDGVLISPPEGCRGFHAYLTNGILQEIP